MAEGLAAAAGSRQLTFFTKLRCTSVSPAHLTRWLFDLLNEPALSGSDLRTAETKN
jgi:hypothetical protein